MKEQIKKAQQEAEALSELPLSDELKAVLITQSLIDNLQTKTPPAFQKGGVPMQRHTKTNREMLIELSKRN